MLFVRNMVSNGHEPCVFNGNTADTMSTSAKLAAKMKADDSVETVPQPTAKMQEVVNTNVCIVYCNFRVNGTIYLTDLNFC